MNKLNITTLLTGVSILLSSSCISIAYAKDKNTVPDGYVKTASQERNNEIVHTFEKPAPVKGTISQTGQQTFARYIDALPENMRDVGIEFQRLYGSQQNLKLAAENSSYLARIMDNSAKIQNHKNIVKKSSVSTMDGGISGLGEEAMGVSPKDMQALSIGQIVELDDTANINTSSVSMALNSASLEGLYALSIGKVKKYAARIKVNGVIHNVVSNSNIGNVIDVVEVTRKGVVLQEEGKTRTISSSELY